MKQGLIIKHLTIQGTTIGKKKVYLHQFQHITEMSQRYSNTTADYMTWDTATNLVRRLYKDGMYRMSLLFGCGIFYGMRVSDLRLLSWDQMLTKDEFVIIEQKTSKLRHIKINKGFQAHIKDCYTALGIKDPAEPCFLNRFGSIMSTQMINKHFKAIKVRYQVNVGNFSSHSLRKTWARQIWEVENKAGRGEQALLKLSELMNHSSPQITRRYIGLRQQELGALYDSLEF